MVTSRTRRYYLLKFFFFSQENHILYREKMKIIRHDRGPAHGFLEVVPENVILPYTGADVFVVRGPAERLREIG